MTLEGHVAADWAIAGYQLFKGSLNGGKRTPFFTQREEAFKSFSARGIPTTSVEEWKFTNITALTNSPFKVPVKAGTLAEPKLTELFGAVLPKNRAVFVDGCFVASLSAGLQQPGMAVYPMGEILAGHVSGEARTLLEGHLARYATNEDSQFVALNTTFVKDGLAISVAPGAVVPEPLHIVFVTTSEAADSTVSPRVLIVAGERSQATVVEHFLASGVKSYFNNSVTEVVTGDGAILEHVKIERESNDAYHVGMVKAYIAKSAQFTSQTFSFGGAMVRNEIAPVFRGEGANCRIQGLTILSSKQHVDNATILDHAEPRCESSELFKGIYADKSKGVFSGTIIVRKDAQKTNAYQSNQTLLLSEDATIDTRPQLKIWADDVKCTHGATVGQLDEDALFYLRSRGIDEATARGILVNSFAAGVLNEVKSPATREMLSSFVNEKLTAILSK